MIIKQIKEVVSIKIKCPKCHHIFESIENPAPMLTVSPEQSERLMGSSFSSMSSPIIEHHSVNPMSPPVSPRSTRSLPVKTMKKGYEEIMQSIKHRRGSTWTELKKDTDLSTKTLSNRLKEGRSVGLFSIDIRKQDGKKVYTCRK